ncbi:hypothetical protein CgunFtcFv8_014942 [Champsocephalus gunnari]|uniref:Uncharacterized protein n=1 Tax=Champsocephalus gunnari TaxID=52237 RepID=A0AAN8I0E7_CHAGU|nr:hypothetical protein CgunFtcFv8_014942 [Champsocephalus gunnari]
MYPWRALTANLHVTQMSPVRPPGAEETEPQVLLLSKEKDRKRHRVTVGFMTGDKEAPPWPPHTPGSHPPGN